MLLLTIIYICISGRRSAVGPSPRLHHNGMPHRWGARPAGLTKDQQGPKKMFKHEDMVIHHGILQATMVSVLVSFALIHHYLLTCFETIMFH